MKLHDKKTIYFKKHLPEAKPWLNKAFLGDEQTGEHIMTYLKKQLAKQQKYFSQQGEIPLAKRVQALHRLKKGLQKFERPLLDALQSDLGKSEMEGYSTEVGFLYLSLNHALKNIQSWARPQRVKNDIAQQPGRSYIYPAAYGTVLIIGPFNYPVQLLLEPLIGAIAGGNTAILKPSELTSNVEAVLVRLIQEVFDDAYVSIVTGGLEVSQELLELPFDQIFFTGSVQVGKIVMEKASRHLTPVLLELGGKSPVIVDKTANLKHAAQKIAWGKFINAGQTCVAPDYVLVEAPVYEQFLKEIQIAIRRFYGPDPQSSPDFGRIVNERHLSRLQTLIEDNKGKLITGGQWEMESRYVAPTVFRDVPADSSLMTDELFGPLLPTMPYKTLADIDGFLAQHPKPLALYVFTENNRFSEKIIRRYPFGGGCVNDTISHVASAHLPFGGVGTSGMGRYHGKYSFDAFTYPKAIVKRSSKIPITFLFPPYKNKAALIRRIIK